MFYIFIIVKAFLHLIRVISEAVNCLEFLPTLSHCVRHLSLSLGGVKFCYLYSVEYLSPDPKILTDLVKTKMPFGKYKGTLLCDMPVHYLEWLKNKGFPPGKLGMLLSSVYEIKINGLSKILTLVKMAH